MAAIDGAGVLTVYPTALKAEQALVARVRAERVLMAPQVTTLPELTDALCTEAGGVGWVLPRELAAVVVARAAEITGAAAKFGLGRGLVREARRTIAEVRAAYLDGEDLEAIAAAMPRGADRDRVGLTAALLRTYEALLGRVGATDRHGREWRALEYLGHCERAGRRPALLEGVERIVFAEIYDYSPVQFLIATSLIRLVGDAELVAFAHPENVDATRFLDRTWNRFVADAAIADQVLPSFALRSGRKGNLAAVLRSIFSPGARPAPEPTDGTVRIIAAPGRYREVEAVGREIRAELAAGRRPERIAVLARDLAPYGDLIEDVCRRFRIPVYFRKGKPLLAVPLVKELLGCLKLVAEGFPRRRLEGLLASGYFRTRAGRAVRLLSEAGYVDEKALPLDACLAELRRRRAGRLGEGAEAAPAEGALRQLDRDIRRLLGVRARLGVLGTPRTVAGYARALREVLARLGFKPVGADESPGPEGRRDALALAAWGDTLAGLAVLGRRLGLGRVELERFIDLLEAALEEQQVEDRAARAGAVRALGVRDARGLDFDVVYVLGLDDGTFPAPHGESPLWPDALKRAVNPLAGARLRAKLGPRGEGLPLGAVFRTTREERLEDPFLFFLALSMATERVVLCYPTVDERGNPTVPSPFLEEVRSIVAADSGAGTALATVPHSDLVPPAADCAEPAELLNRAVLERRRSGDDALAAALGERLGPGRLASIARRAAIEEERRSVSAPDAEGARQGRAGPWCGRLSTPPQQLASVLLAMPWSPTRLEELAACPFRFFAHYLLGIEPPDDPTVEVVPLELGSLVHRVLEEVGRTQRELPADRQAARAVVGGVLERTRAKAEQRIAPKDPAFLEICWEQVAAIADVFVAAELEASAQRKAQGLELHDRWTERPLCFRLVDDEGRLGMGRGCVLRLAARPDRVDLLARDGRIAAVEVLDYKTSRNRAEYVPRVDLGKRLGITAFQIPVYLMGVLAILAEQGKEPPLELRGGFLVLRASEKPRVVGSVPVQVLRAGGAAAEQVAGGAGSEQESASVPARILDLVGAAVQGRFDAGPRACMPRRCPYRYICRIGPGALAAEEEQA